MINNRKQKNTMLGMLMLMLFGYPILTIVNRNEFVGSFPLLYIYIGVVWLVSLILLVIAAESKPFQKIKRHKDE